MVRCNVCGKEMNVWDEQQMFRVHTRLSYGSEHDGDYLALDLCSECIDKFVKDFSPKCKIPFLHETDNGDVL